MSKSVKVSPFKIKATVPIVFILFVFSALSTNILWLCLTYLGIAIALIISDLDRFSASLHYYKLQNSKTYFQQYKNGNKSKTKNKYLNALLKELEKGILIEEDAFTTKEQQYGSKEKEDVLFLALKIFHFSFFKAQEGELYNKIHKLNLSQEGYVFCLQQCIFEILEEQPDLLQKPTGKKCEETEISNKASKMILLNMNNVNFQQAMLNDLPEIQNLKANLPEEKDTIQAIDVKAKLDNAMEKILNERTEPETDKETEDTSWKI